MTVAAAPVALATELVDLKRVRFAGASVATVGFTRAWTALVRGLDPAVVAGCEARAAVAATQLGAIDVPVLRDAGLSLEQSHAVIDRAVEAALASGGLSDPACARVRGCGEDEALQAVGDPPGFVARLAGAPRAGVTAPGRPRYVLEPTESHAEHCWAVGVLAVLVAEDEDAGTEAFLCALAHHLHNAWLPDGGFAGEMALGEHLEPVLAGFRERGLAQLPAPLAARCRDAVGLAGHADTAAARAFNTADVADRLLELRFHQRAAAFTLREAVEDYEIVHAGPLQGYGMQVVRDWGLDR